MNDPGWGEKNRKKGGNKNGGFVAQGGAAGRGLSCDPDLTGLGSLHEDPKNVAIDECTQVRVPQNAERGGFPIWI
jgi:hypothetical protein